MIKDFTFVDDLVDSINQNQMAALVRIQGYSTNLRGVDNALMKNQEGKDIPFKWDYFIRNCLNNESVINRVASVKAMAQASRYLNGVNITQDMIIHTTEKSDGTSDTEIIESIRENSIGYVKAMELLTNFVRSDGKQVFIFASKLNNNK